MKHSSYVYINAVKLVGTIGIIGITIYYIDTFRKAQGIPTWSDEIREFFERKKKAK